MNPWHVEPVAIAALIRSLILLLTAFGFHLTAEQIAAVMVFVECLLAVVIRQKVTPNATNGKS